MTPEQLVEHGNQLFAKGDVQGAIDSYTQAIQVKPDYVNAYHNRGLAYHKAGRHQDAIADFDKTIELSPKMAQAYYNRGNAKLAMGRPNAAIMDFNAALKLKPDLAKAQEAKLAATRSSAQQSIASRIQQAKRFEAQGLKDRAADEWEAVVDLDPANPEARAGLARCRKKSSPAGLVIAAVVLVVGIAGLGYLVSQRTGSKPPQPQTQTKPQTGLPPTPAPRNDDEARLLAEREKERKQKAEEGLARAKAATDPEEALRILDEYATFLSGNDDAPKVREEILAKRRTAWLNKLRGMMDAGKHEQVLAEIQRYASSYGAQPSDIDPLREEAQEKRTAANVAELQKLIAESRFAEAMDALQKVWHALGDAEGLKQRVAIKNAWFTRIVELADQGKHQDAIAQLDKLQLYDVSDIGLDKVLATRGKAVKGRIRQLIAEKKWQEADTLLRQNWDFIKPEKERKQLYDEIEKGSGGQNPG